MKSVCVCADNFRRQSESREKSATATDFVGTSESTCQGNILDESTSDSNVLEGSTADAAGSAQRLLTSEENILGATRQYATEFTPRETSRSRALQAI